MKDFHPTHNTAPCISSASGSVTHRGPLAAFCQNEEVAQTPSELMSERVSGSSAVCRCHGLFNRPHGENRGRRKHTHTVETSEQRNARARPDTLTAVSDRPGRTCVSSPIKGRQKEFVSGGDSSCTSDSGFGRTGQFLTGLCGLVPQLRKQNMITRSLEKTSCKEYRKETRNETNCGELLGGEKKEGWKGERE